MAAETHLVCNMKIATWNVNSLRSRFEHLVTWLRTFQPDVVLLQELKLVTELFPTEQLLDEGYQSAAFGQKTYNGVAILSKHSIEDVSYNFNNTPLPEEARYIQALINGQFTVASVYVPNGQSTSSEKYPLKLAFMEHLHTHLQQRHDIETPFIIGGDFNIAPQDGDATYPERWQGNVPFTLNERHAYNRILHDGFHDAVRIKYPYHSDANPDTISWWDYRGGSFEKNNGLRIDHILLCPQATQYFQDAGTDRTPRTWEKPSDHTPVWCELQF